MLVFYILLQPHILEVTISELRLVYIIQQLPTKHQKDWKVQIFFKKVCTTLGIHVLHNLTELNISCVKS